MKKLLLLGSVVSPCPPLKYGGSERVVYYQAKQLALHGINLILIGAKNTKVNFEEQLKLENVDEKDRIINNIEFVEIGGGTQASSTSDSLQIDLSKIEASRKIRLEMSYLSQVEEYMVNHAERYDVILNNMRGGETLFLPLASHLHKKIVNVMHLNIFDEMAERFKKYNPYIITISECQKHQYRDLNYLETIYNPISTDIFTFSEKHGNYALFIGSFGKNKNPLDAIKASKQARIPLILAGKISDETYFNTSIKPYIDNKQVFFKGEIGLEEKVDLYRNAKVFLFPVLWNEPFGLVLTESLACGTPVICYPNGGPSEIVINGKNGFLVNSPSEMADKIRIIDSISRQYCRDDVIQRFSDTVIGQIYVKTLLKIM